MKKSDITLRATEPFNNRALPAINVKVYGIPADVEKRLSSMLDSLNAYMSNEEQEELLQIAFDQSRADFWNDTLPEIIEESYGPTIEKECFVQGGRSGGWVIFDTDGYKDFEEWDAVDVNRWQGFVRRVEKAVLQHCSYEYLKGIVEDMIEEATE